MLSTFTRLKCRPVNVVSKIIQRFFITFYIIGNESLRKESLRLSK